MPQNVEATAFLASVAKLPPGPGVLLDDVLKPCLAGEAELRKLFAQDKTNPRLRDPYVGLVDVFDAPPDIRTTRARVIATPEDMEKSYIMPLDNTSRRKEGAPAMVDSLEEFKKNWAIFTEGSLAQLTDWSNVVVAGGAVQACLAPVPESAKASKRDLRKHFHSQAFPSSDVDLFLYGLTPEQAEAKMKTIFEAVRDSIPWDVTCIRTKHTISIHSQYPYRAVQIVLRLYQSPAEVLAGFDVDAPCCAFDGSRVYANPRAIVAMMRQCNTVDVTRRSPSYEVRLTKYSSRGFEIYVPQLNRADIDPTIFERSITRIQGLARLLVLEKLGTSQARDNYLESRKQIRGRPSKYNPWSRSRRVTYYKNDLKDTNMELEMSDYDVVSLHIPYGPGWDARRIEKLIYKTDYGMNSPYNPKNKDRYLHRHSAFFGSMEHVLEDCCEDCPTPENDEERELQEEEDKSYVRGRIQFIVEDPGRQSISGSFNPIDDGEWSEQAYMGLTEKFFQAIAANDKAAVEAAIQGGIDVDRRDHVGRTPLQLAIMARSVDVACALIDAGARMTYRLVDGMTALHLAAQLDQPVILKKMLERSKLNDEQAKNEEEEAKRAEEEAKRVEKESQMDVDDEGEDDDCDDDTDSDSDRDSSDDDWSSDDGTGKNKTKEQNNDDLIPEDDKDVPDVFELDTADWDYHITPLLYAILARSAASVDLLCTAGADPKLVTTPTHKHNASYVYPLLLAINIKNDDVACQISQRLITAGTITSEADDNLYTMLHRAVDTDRPKIVSTFLRHDPNARAVINIPWMHQSLAIWPVVSALQAQSYGVLAVLLAHGGKLVIDEDDFGRARDLRMKQGRSVPANLHDVVPLPIDVALANYNESLHLLVALGADINRLIRRPTVYYGFASNRMTPLDFARHGLEELKKERERLAKAKEEKDSNKNTGLLAQSYVSPNKPQAEDQELPQPPPAWESFLLGLIEQCEAVEAAHREKNKPEEDKRMSTYKVAPRSYFDDIQTYFQDAEATLLAHGAKTADELFPPEPPKPNPAPSMQQGSHMLGMLAAQPAAETKPKRQYFGIQPPFNFHRHGMNEGTGMRRELALRYRELFTAIWEGNHSKIQQLCLPAHNKKAHETPLQISVHWGDSYKGYSSLYLAILARRWDTAKLILAIATAQHRPREQKEMQTTWNSRDILADDSDEELNEMMDDSDDDYMSEEEPVDFFDLAKRPSELYTAIAPKYMLEHTFVPAVNKDGETTNTYTPFAKAIEDEDLEVFVQIIALYKSLSGESGVNLLFNYLDTLISKDRASLLDEYIRQTGFGVTIKAQATDDSAVGATSKGRRRRREYLGLNVDGKKRGDLAQAAEEHHYSGGTEYFRIPLLWQAVQAGSRNIIDYLATHKPLDAYRFYASAGGDEQARMLKTVPHLAGALPELLGWTPNALNETVLTAAVIKGDMKIVELLCALRPDDMKAAVQLRHRIHGCNSIMLAIKLGCSVEMFDFLFDKGASPLEIDSHRRNIMHILSNEDSEEHWQLLEHIVQKLPQDDVHKMLKRRNAILETPLHIACRRSRMDVARLLLSTGAPQLLIRDGGGSTALHNAVKNGYAKLAKLLIDAGPTELIDLEDVVGTTPLETATRPVMLSRLDIKNTTSKSCPTATINLYSNPFDLSRHEKGLPVLRETLADLLREGKLLSGTKTVNAFEALADKIEARIAREKRLSDEWKKAVKEANAKSGETRDENVKIWQPERDYRNDIATLKVLKEALAARPTPRRLVHLSDVHASVQRSLDQYGTRARTSTSHEEGEETHSSNPVPVVPLPYSPLISNYH